MTQTMVTSGTMTNRIDRLAARDLVQRLPDPDDGRGVIVRITAAGARLVDTAMEGLLHREQGLLAALTPAERDELVDLLRRLVAPFDAG
jgi:DNA-binding MarR family transcriptional regulator